MWEEEEKERREGEREGGVRLECGEEKSTEEDDDEARVAIGLLSLLQLIVWELRTRSFLY